MAPQPERYDWTIIAHICTFLVGLAITIAEIYVAVHFIRKYW